MLEKHSEGDVFIIECENAHFLRNYAYQIAQRRNCKVTTTVKDETHLLVKITSKKPWVRKKLPPRVNAALETMKIGEVIESDETDFKKLASRVYYYGLTHDKEFIALNVKGDGTFQVRRER